jgi:Uma2 family endonuclease
MATVTAIRIGPADHGRAMTLEEFMDAETEEGYRYELARGVLEVSEVPNDPHGEIVCLLIGALWEYRKQHPGVIQRSGGAGEFRLWLPGMISGRIPDVAVVLTNTPKDRRGRRPPSLVMEVVSEGSEVHQRDYSTKRQEYLAFGIREYWIVDPVVRMVTILVRDGDVWVEQVFRDGQKATSSILPGLAIETSTLWAEFESVANEKADEQEEGEA